MNLRVRLPLRLFGNAPGAVGVLVSVLGVCGEARAATPVALADGRTQFVPKLDAIEREISVQIPGVKSGQARLYPVSTSAADKEAKTCRLPIGTDGGVQMGGATTAGCVELIDALAELGAGAKIPDVRVEAAGRTFTFKVSEPSVQGVADVDVATLALQPPVQTPKAFWYQQADSIWVKAQPAELGSNVLTAVKLQLSSNKAARVYCDTGVGVVAVDYTVKEAPPIPPAPPLNFEAECVKSFAGDATTFDSPHDGRYALCADLTDLSAPRVCLPQRRVEEGKPVDECHDPGFELLPNLLFDLRIWRDSDTQISVDLSGTPGRVSSLYVAPRTLSEGAAAGAGGATQVSTLHRFAPRQDEYVAMHFVLKRGTDTLLDYSQPFRIKRQYRFALRTGVVALWAPNDHEFAAQSSGDPGNPGKEIVVEKGGDAGLTSAEIAVGLSWFWSDLDSYEVKPVLGAYLGLGVVSASAKGVDALTSIMAGPELSLGKNFSIAAVFALRRTRALDENVKVGQRLPVDATEVPTSLAVTPALGVMLNLSPYVWDAVPH